DTVQYDKKAGSYRCQLDEQWFELTKDTLREALQITRINNNQPFIAPLSSDVLINFVNELGYPKLVRNVSNEEFVQSIHTFIEDKQNLSRHTTGKKRAALIVIPSIWFTKLIIHHLQRRHKFHPRPDSPLYLPNEEPVLGYLKFSAKGMKREVFGMPIPGSLIIADIQAASYYQEYLANVAKHRRYLASETGSVQDSAAPKPTKPARKPKSTAPKAEDVPVMEPRVAAEDTDLQKALEKSMKTTYSLSRGSLLPVVIREPESGKYQPLPEVPGKGKAKVTGEQSDSKEESEKVVLGADVGGQGQAGSNPDEISEGQARPDPGNAEVDVHSIPSPVVHVGSDREHMDLDVADVSPQPTMEQLDEGFTAIAYPKSRDISFGDLFFSDKPLDTDKNAETEVESMVNVPIQQALSSIPLMTLPIIDLTSRPESPKVSKAISEVVTDAVDWAIQAPLRNRFRDLPEADMKEILHQRMWETESYKSHKDHMQLFKALEKSMNRDHSEELAQDLAEARKKKKNTIPSRASRAPGASGSSQVPQPPPPPSSTNQESTSKGSTAPSSSKTAASAEYQAWTTTDVRLRSSISLTPADLEMDADMAPDEQPQSSDDEDIGTLASKYSPPPEESLLAQTGDIATFMDWFCKRGGITELKPQDLEVPAFEIVKVIHPDGRRHALSISKMKAAYYPDTGLEQMVPDQFWIEEECKYDIVAMYGISHWWFQRQ
nr:hypothetical protein [Tanacetum cinerariifolium]